MKYSRLTFQYMKRRWLYVLIYGIIPALAFTLTTKPVSIFNMIIGLKDNPGLNFLDVWLGATEISWRAFLVILSGLAFIVCCSAFMGVMERDMRLGDLTHKKFFTRVNNNFLIIFKVFLVFLVFLELFGVINAALIYLWYKVFNNYVLVAVFSFATLAILSVLAVAIALLGVLWIPTMIMTGLNMRKSLVESLQLVKGKIFRLIFDVILPALPFFALVMVSNYFELVWLNLFTELLLNLFVVSYYPILMFVVYFDATGTDREDLKKKIWEVNK